MLWTLGYLRETLSHSTFSTTISPASASGGVFARSVACPPWGLWLSGTHQLAVHTVVKGRAWLCTTDPQSPIELAPGDLALVRGGPDHHIAHTPAAHCLTHEPFLEHHADDEHSEDRHATAFLRHSSQSPARCRTSAR